MSDENNRGLYFLFWFDIGIILIRKYAADRSFRLCCSRMPARSCGEYHIQEGVQNERLHEDLPGMVIKPYLMRDTKAELRAIEGDEE